MRKLKKLRKVEKLEKTVEIIEGIGSFKCKSVWLFTWGQAIPQWQTRLTAELA